MDFADPDTAPTILPFTKFEIMGESEMLCARLLAYVAGTMNQELLLRNDYLAADNRILRGQIKGRLLLSEGEKATLAEIAHRLAQMVVEDVATELASYRAISSRQALHGTCDPVPWRSFFDGLAG